MINPNDVTTISVGELPSVPITIDSLIALGKRWFKQVYY
jgi:hypothetical protein